MEMAGATQNNGGHFSCGCEWIKALRPERLNSKIVEFARKIKKIGQEDPRRIIHSLKVGLAITLISLSYYFDPLYEGFGVSAMWAVITVVVVFEFSVGATLGRGINRTVATCVAATLGYGAHDLAELSGDKIEPVVIGLSVFLFAAMVSYARFFPRMKERYDYGLLIFIMTFSMISVSGYRSDEVLDMVNMRISTIIIGGLTAVFICTCICPVWAGEDLHKLAAANIEELGKFLEGFGIVFFQRTGGQVESIKASLQGYKRVLTSKNTEDSLANFARWEPCHGRFRFHHPWKQYIKIGSLVRQCAYRIEALNGYLVPEIQAPPEIRDKIQDVCTKMSSESGKALKELALAVKTMTSPTSASIHIGKSKNATENMKSLLKTNLHKDIDLLEIIPTITVVSLLVEVVSCTEKIAESIQELASLARFKNGEVQREIERTKSSDKETLPRLASMDVSPLVVTVE